jgi:hypothetical protein
VAATGVGLRRLHQLIDELSADVPTDLLERLLRAVRDGQRVEPLDLVLLFAPLDDEPVTDADRAAIAAAEEDEAAGRVRTHAEVWRRFRRLPQKRALRLAVARSRTVRRSGRSKGRARTSPRR